MIQRINIYRIVKDHLKTLRSLNQSYKFINIGDFLLFFIIPCGISLTLTLNGYNFNNQLDNLMTSISILGGFLFNLLAIIYSQIDNLKVDAQKLENKEEKEIKNKFINEIHSNISFAIVLSIFLIISLLSITIDMPVNKYKIIIEQILIFINYFFMQLFTLTLLMIINRIYLLFKKTAE